MKREKGFSLLELLVVTAITVIVMSAAISMLDQAQHVTQGIGLEANMQEDLRAGMHFMVRDMMQAGEGIPEGGIMLPYTSAAAPTPAPIVRPDTTPVSNFLAQYVALPAIIPGYQLGQAPTGVNAQTGAVIATPNFSDIITILYADNTLVDSSANKYALNQFAVAQSPPGGQACAGTISAAGTSVTLDANCFSIPATQPTIQPGDLILFTSAAGTALQLVTKVTGQTISFAFGDPAGLNGLNAGTYPDGTVANLVANEGTAPLIYIDRIWMITYYEDSTTNPLRPQLVRQVNYPAYPTLAGATYPPQPIGEAIENLQFTYDIIDSTAPAGTYGAAGPGDATSPNLTYDSALQIRAVNISLFGRSEYPYVAAGAFPQYLHNNLSTQVSIRNMSFVPVFNTSPDASQVATPGP